MSTSKDTNTAKLSIISKITCIFLTIIKYIVVIISALFCIISLLDFLSTKDSFDLFMILFFCLPGLCVYFLLNIICSKIKKNYHRKEPASNPSNIGSESIPLQEPIQDTVGSNDPSLIEKSEGLICSCEESTTDLPILSRKEGLLKKKKEKEKEKEKENIIFPDWYISISFGKSSSQNYQKAVVLAKNAPQYHEQNDGGVILHQAIYSSKSSDYLNFISLYELVCNWKSSFVMINGKIIDRKIVGNLNYCYGDKCRSGNRNFCYGASYMTGNPFGCHRLQISACNNPWWSFYIRSGTKWILDKAEMRKRIDSYAEIYSLCPAFDYAKIISALQKLPDRITDREFQKIKQRESNRINLNY